MGDSNDDHEQQNERLTRHNVYLLSRLVGFASAIVLIAFIAGRYNAWVYGGNSDIDALCGKYYSSTTTTLGTVAVTTAMRDAREYISVALQTQYEINSLIMVLVIFLLIWYVVMGVLSFKAVRAAFDVPEAVVTRLFFLDAIFSMMIRGSIAILALLNLCTFLDKRSILKEKWHTGFCGNTELYGATGTPTQNYNFDEHEGFGEDALIAVAVCACTFVLTGLLTSIFVNEKHLNKPSNDHPRAFGGDMMLIGTSRSSTKSNKKKVVDVSH